MLVSKILLTGTEGILRYKKHEDDLGWVVLVVARVGAGSRHVQDGAVVVEVLAMTSQAFTGK